MKKPLFQLFFTLANVSLLVPLFLFIFFLSFFVCVDMRPLSLSLHSLSLSLIFGRSRHESKRKREGRVEAGQLEGG